MSAKKSRFQTRTIIYIAIIVLIILALAAVILNYEETEQVYSVPTVINNPNNYNNLKITVEGIYYTQSDTERYLVDVYPTVANENPQNRLPLNLEYLDNTTTDSLVEDQQYTATGTFVVLNDFGSFELIVDKIITS